MFSIPRDIQEMQDEELMKELSKCMEQISNIRRNHEKLKAADPEFNIAHAISKWRSRESYVLYEMDKRKRTQGYVHKIQGERRI